MKRFASSIECDHVDTQCIFCTELGSLENQVECIVWTMEVDHDNPITLRESVKQ